jgi:hypothetical protein
MIGDRSGDMDSAAAAGVGHRILVTSGDNKENQLDLVKSKGGLFVMPSIVEASRFIRQYQRLSAGGCWNPRAL